MIFTFPTPYSGPKSNQVFPFQDRISSFRGGAHVVLNVRKAAKKLLIRPAERIFCVDSCLPADIHHREEEIAAALLRADPCHLRR